MNWDAAKKKTEEIRKIEKLSYIELIKFSVKREMDFLFASYSAVSETDASELRFCFSRDVKELSLFGWILELISAKSI